MIKKAATLVIVVFWAAIALSAPKNSVEKFIADPEFCAYMASTPENDTEYFLTRYQAAMQAAISFIRQKNPKTTETQAIFSIKAQCDTALSSLIHYK